MPGLPNLRDISVAKKIVVGSQCQVGGCSHTPFGGGSGIEFVLIHVCRVSIVIETQEAANET